jgi:CDP-glucose 4,6-dehydratase
VSSTLDGRAMFVTGGYGLLGSWLVKALVAAGARVSVLRYDAQRPSALAIEGTEREVDVIDGDVSDGTQIDRAIGQRGVDLVFHLAAQTIVGTAKAAPVATFEANVQGTWTVLEACRAHEVKGVVVASSDKAYGAHDELPYREGHALQARYPYDVSKAAAEMIACSYWHTYGVPVAITRCANLYGGGDLNFSRLVPEAVTAALDGRAPVIRSDGTLERDYLYVEDAVGAYLAIAELLDAGSARGEAYNAGGDTPHSVLEVATLACRLAGSEVEPDVRGRGVPEGEIARQFVDSGKLRTATGWRPEVDLEEGLRRTVSWYREHADVRAT